MTQCGYATSQSAFPPNSTEINARGINDSGVIAGYYSDKDSNTHGFIRTP